MDGKKWIKTLFDSHREDRRKWDNHNEMKLIEERAFRNLLPDYTTSLQASIRGLVETMNAELAEDGRRHAVQLNETDNGCELLTAELPLHVVRVNADAHAVEYGTRGGKMQRLRLVLRDNAIVGEPEGFGGGDAEFVIRDFLVAGIKKIT